MFWCHYNMFIFLWNTHNWTLEAINTYGNGLAPIKQQAMSYTDGSILGYLRSLDWYTVASWGGCCNYKAWRVGVHCTFIVMHLFSVHWYLTRTPHFTSCTPEKLLQGVRARFSVLYFPTIIFCLLIIRQTLSWTGDGKVQRHHMTSPVEELIVGLWKLCGIA